MPGVQVIVFLLAYGLTSFVWAATEFVPTATPNEGDPRPPFLNRIVRVSRGPTIPSSIEAEAASLFLKPPAYQLRFRPHRLSQFHGYPVLNGQIPNSNGLSILNMPGIASHHPASLALNNNNNNNYNSIYNPAQQHSSGLSSESDEIDQLDENQAPTFTPFISARALSNMEKFFEHLRENIEALQTSDTTTAERSHRSSSTNDNANDDNVSDNDDAASGISWEDASAEFPSVLSTAIRTGGFRWIPPASGAHNREAAAATTGGDQSSDQVNLKPRPKFNPSWVKLGLGKRKR